MKQSLTKEWLKENSIKENCSVADLFQRIVIEDFLQRIFEGENGMRFVLVNDKQIYGKTIGLRFKKPMDIAKKEFENRLDKTGEISWTILEESAEKADHLKLFIEAQYEDMKVPVTVELEYRENDPLYLERKELTLTLENDSIFYCVCAPEQQLSECFFMILDRLELISSMEYYDEAFEILNTYTVDGRRFAEELLSKMKKNSLDEMVMFKIKEYRDYHYMEKRWNSFVKNKAFQQKRLKKFGVSSSAEKSLEWKEIVDYLCKFVGPVYLTLCKDEIFIGDWMPELGRFM